MAKKKRSSAIGRFAALNRALPAGQSAELPQGPAEMLAQVGAIAERIAEALEPKTEAAAIAAAKIGAAAMDASISNALRSTHERPACEAGCNYCCRGVRVDVSIPEIAGIVDYAEKNLEADILQRVRARALANAEQTHGKDVLQYPLRLPCALLGDDGNCLVYSVRPVTCRNEHSKSADECKAGHDAQELGVDTPIERIFALQAAGGMVVVGAARGVEQATGDAAPCELQEALHIALSTPGAIDRWLAGEDAFVTARVDISEPMPEPLVVLRKK